MLVKPEELEMVKNFEMIDKNKTILDNTIIINNLPRKKIARKFTLGEDFQVESSYDIKDLKVLEETYEMLEGLDYEEMFEYEVIKQLEDEFFPEDEGDSIKEFEFKNSGYSMNLIEDMEFKVFI